MVEEWSMGAARCFAFVAILVFCNIPSFLHSIIPRADRSTANDRRSQPVTYFPAAPYEASPPVDPSAAIVARSGMGRR
jgi:hypothetical protein